MLILIPRVLGKYLEVENEVKDLDIIVVPIVKPILNVDACRVLERYAENLWKYLVIMSELVITLLENHGMTNTLVKLLRNCKEIICIGPSTRMALKKLNFDCKVPKVYSSSGVELYLKSISDRVLILRSEEFERELNIQNKVELRMYRLDKIVENIEYAIEILKICDAVVFTSSKLFKIMYEELKSRNKLHYLDKVKIVAIGEVTAETISRYGYNAITPKTYTINEALRLCKVSLKKTNNIVMK